MDYLKSWLVENHSGCSGLVVRLGDGRLEGDTLMLLEDGDLTWEGRQSEARRRGRGKWMR